MSLVGRHMPLEGRAEQAMRTARLIGCDVVQIFVGNPRGWAAAPDRPEEIAELVGAIQAAELAPVVIHAAYLINLPSNKDDIRRKSVDLLRWTLDRGAAIGASDVVLHIGSHGGDGLEVGMERLLSGLEAVLATVQASTTPRLLLENDVGAGNTIGSSFDSLATILAAVRPSWGERIGICLDTAHLWGAGYDIGTPESAQAILDQFDAVVGLGAVRVIHLNDTAVKLGAHRDLHARLGEGIIGQDGLRTFLRDPRLGQATILLETPIVTLPDSEKHDWNDDTRRVAEARALAAREPSQ